jgi:hypothetical protein
MPQINDVGNLNNAPGEKKTAPMHNSLVTWIMNIVSNSRESRDQQYKAKWDAYERTFRGFHSPQDRTREGERSKLIAPALLQAIDSTAATIDEAIFSRDQWFDAVDDINDREREDVERARLNLNEDFETAGVPDVISKIDLNGCLYGTGVGKINVIKKEIKTVLRTEQGVQIQSTIRPLVTLEPIPPWEFVIDSQARRLEDALFVAHETNVPRNVVLNKIRKGVYRNVPISGYSAAKPPTPAGYPVVDQTHIHNKDDGSVNITEYYGKAPAAMVRPFAEVKPEDSLGGMVEIIATIANETEALRVIVNPFLMKDRPIVAYQHDIVPGKFWGRGVAEKGWNAQRALDAELRARMDALGLLTSPMMGADITRLPRNPDMRVRPGKVWLTRGRPSEVLEPVILGNIDPTTFNQSSEMERLVQVATGSIESNAPLNVDRRNETASGISMIQSSALKRMRRTMWNLERQLLNPLIKKSLWRFMQFSPNRYAQDFEFTVKGTMGIVAREFEQSNLTALLSVIPPDSPAYQSILRGVVELSGTPKRDELLKQIEESFKPDPEAQKMQQQQMQLAMEAAQLENEEKKAEIEKIRSEVALNKAKEHYERVKADLEDEKVDIQAANAVIGREKAKATHRQNEIAAERNVIDKIKARKGDNSGSSKR